ncbi:phosphatase PAP2 family protein [Silvimonas soli]|uniref:phosphatase PAP2 family protein n=1 Tax=Silvimonas soli TaxID=2980100 RepID=UPI0024B35CAA|nr:phosphatase PAP2 family protein [Silvimonas soli]
MEQLNNALFLLINAPANPSHGMLLLGIFCAEYLVLLVPLGLAAGWLRGDNATREILLQAVAAMLIGLLINWLIALGWQHPRPFAIGLGHNLVAHSSSSSFPSNHMTAWWAAAFTLYWHKPWHRTGIALSLTGLLIAWARVYVGVHYPFDMIGAAVVALFSAWLSTRYGGWVVQPVLHWLTRLYRTLFAPLIRRGWVRA